MKQFLITALTCICQTLAYSYDHGIAFNAIERSWQSTYWQRGMYGANTRPALTLFNFPYIYLEIGGEEIEEGAVVTQWIQIGDADYAFNYGNDTHPNATFHQKQPGYEFVECSVRFSANPNTTWTTNEFVHVNSYYS